MGLNDYFNHNLSLIYPSITSEPLELARIRHIFNAGMLMFNLDVWRTNNFTEQSIELYRFNKIFSDKFGSKPWSGVTQPILNMLFIINRIDVGELDKKWNIVIKDLVKSCNKKIKKKREKDWNQHIFYIGREDVNHLDLRM